MFIAHLLTPEITDLIEQRDWINLKNVISDWPSPDIADLLGYLDSKDSVILFRLLHKNTASDVFSKLGIAEQEDFLTKINNAEVENLILNTAYDDRTDLFEDLPGRLTQRILNVLPASERVKSLELLGYPEMSVGRLMTPNYIAVKSNLNIQNAIDHIRSRGQDAETVDMIFVVDNDWKLLDDVPIKRFILAEPDQMVHEIMNHTVISIEAKQDQEEAYHLIERYDLNVLPVVDTDGVLLGIVTVDDIIDVLEEEVTEDFQKASAIHPVEENYTVATPFLLYKKRIGWLTILLVADFLSSNILAHYEFALKAVISLAFFIPILIDSGGNTAAQASTLVIRALATGELTLKRWFLVVRKEMLIGLMLALTLACILYIRSFFWKGGPQVGLVVGFSMFLIVIWANLLGSLLPIILTKLKFDPAVTSSPLLTTIVDSTGLLIYFTSAQFIFNLV
jgi:magnesium transporter